MKKIIGMVALGALVIAVVVFAATNNVFAGGLKGIGNPGKGPGGGALGKYMTQATAEVFGMTTAELEAAQESGKTLMDIASDQGLSVKDFLAKMKTVRDKAIDLAAAAGDITQTQAEWMKSQNGQGPQRGAKRGGMIWGQGYLHDEMISAMATVLGLDAKDLETKLEAGERLPEIATAQGISTDDWPAKMKEAMTNAINAALKDGKTTQAQADAMLERLENRGGPRFGPNGSNATPPANAPADAGGGPGGEGFMGPPDGGLMDPGMGMMF